MPKLKGPIPRPVTGPISTVLLFSGPQTKEGLCEALDVSPRFIENEVKAGRLRGVIIGSRTIRFLPRDIEAWLNLRPTREREEMA